MVDVPESLSACCVAAQMEAEAFTRFALQSDMDPVIEVGEIIVTSSRIQRHTMRRDETRFRAVREQRDPLRAVAVKEDSALGSTNEHSVTPLLAPENERWRTWQL